jgi:hypothetical protein
MASEQQQLPLHRGSDHTLLRKNPFSCSKRGKVAENNSRVRMISRRIEKRCQVVFLDQVVVGLNADELGLLACTCEHCGSIFDPS